VRSDLPPRARIPGFLSVCMIPSVVFWSSALLKESAVMGFVAATAAAILMLLRTGRALWLVPAVAAATPVWLLKPYLLAPMLIAAIVAAYVARMRRFGRQRFRWTLLVRGLLPLLVAYVIVSVALPRWSPARVLEDAERQQSIGLREDMMEGSRYSLVPAGETLSATRLVLVAPLALVTTLARPLPGEVLNAQGLAASLEIFAFLLAMLRLLRRRGLRGLGQAALDHPWVAFALIFVGLGGVGIGIGTFNLGTLARYRMPLMPFYALVVFTLPSVLPPLRRAEHRRQT